MPGQTRRPSFSAGLCRSAFPLPSTRAVLLPGGRRLALQAVRENVPAALNSGCRAKRPPPSHAPVCRLAPRGAGQVRREACVQPSEPTDCPFSAGLCRSAFPLPSIQVILPPGRRSWGLQAARENAPCATPDHGTGEGGPHPPPLPASISVHWPSAEGRLARGGANPQTTLFQQGFAG